jgi:hypothetical protein
VKPYNVYQTHIEYVTVIHAHFDLGCSWVSCAYYSAL